MIVKDMVIAYTACGWKDIENPFKRICQEWKWLQPVLMLSSWLMEEDGKRSLNPVVLGDMIDERWLRPVYE
jgi:hypothetical protein